MWWCSGMGGASSRESRQGEALTCAAAAGHRSAAALESLLALVEDDGEDDHRALDQDLPERRDAEDHESVGEKADDEGADQGPTDGSAAAMSAAPPITTAAMALSSKVSPA